MFVESSEEGERYINITADIFDDIKSDFHTTIDDTYYEVVTKKEDDYILFSFDFGKANPRDTKVTNVITGNKKDNPRQGSEAELLKQLFCLYHFEKQTLYISNYQKLTFFLSVLQKQLNKSFITKSFFKDKEEFMSILKSVSKISFTEARELFNQNSTERQALTDLTGTNAPDKFTIEAEYSQPSGILPFLKKLFSSKDRDALKDLMICGKDERNFSVIYNHETFLRRLSIKCEKEENGKFNSDTVLNKLLEEVLK